MARGYGRGPAPTSRHVQGSFVTAMLNRDIAVAPYGRGDTYRQGQHLYFSASLLHRKHLVNYSRKKNRREKERKKGGLRGPLELRVSEGARVRRARSMPKFSFKEHSFCHSRSGCLSPASQWQGSASIRFFCPFCVNLSDFFPNIGKQPSSLLSRCVFDIKSKSSFIYTQLSFSIANFLHDM